MAEQIKFKQITVMQPDERDPTQKHPVLFALDDAGDIWWSNVGDGKEHWQQYSSVEESIARKLRERKEAFAKR